MINQINDTNAITALGAVKTKNSDQGNGFDAALEAEQKAQARQAAHDSEMASIKEKGFTNWVRDTRIEKLKEELRKKIMASMGLDEDSLKAMEPLVQKILEQKIQDEVEKQLQQALKEQDLDASQSDQTTAQGPQTQTAQTEPQSGKKDRDGISCPVIPAQAQAGGAILW